MTGTLSRSWWLLALCGILDGMHAILNLLMMNPNGLPGLRSFGNPGAVWDMGAVAIAAGVCVTAAGLWSSGRNHSWLLVLHGLALGGFGVLAVSPLVRGPLSFRPVSLLFVAMAVTVGAFALSTGANWRSSTAERRLFRAAGWVSIAFAFSFLAVGFQWIALRPSYVFFLWMSSYFGFCATFMLWLALRLRGRGLAETGRLGPFSQLPAHRSASV